MKFVDYTVLSEIASYQITLSILDVANRYEKQVEGGINCPNAFANS